MLVWSLNPAVIITLDWNVLFKAIDMVRYLLFIIYKFLSITLHTLSYLMFIKILWGQHNHYLRLILEYFKAQKASGSNLSSSNESLGMQAKGSGTRS